MNSESMKNNIAQVIAWDKCMEFSTIRYTQLFSKRYDTFYKYNPITGCLKFGFSNMIHLN